MWELREIVAYLRKQGRAAVDEQAIFRARDRLKEIEDRAAGKTKASRRAISRRIIPEGPAGAKIGAIDASDEDIDFDSVLPFEDMKSHWKYK